MIRFVLFLVLLASCSGPRYSLRKVAGLSGAKVKEIPVATDEEAQKVIRNQLNFLKLLFQQSHDPYYGLPKWTDACLRANQIGELLAVNGGSLAVSSLYLDANQTAGACPGQTGAMHSWVVYSHCSRELVVREIKIPITDRGIDFKHLCE